MTLKSRNQGRYQLLEKLFPLLMLFRHLFSCYTTHARCYGYWCSYRADIGHLWNAVTICRGLRFAE